MKIGDMRQRATDIALEAYHKWNEVTGYPPTGTSYDYELQGVMEEAAGNIVDMANKLKLKLTKKQVNRLARAEYPHMCSEIADLAGRLLDSDDALIASLARECELRAEVERLLTVCKQLRTGWTACVELARGKS